MKPDRLIEDLTLVPLPQWWENPWLLLSLPVVIGLVAYFVQRWWVRRRPAAAIPQITDIPVPTEAFLARLAALRSDRPRWSAYPFAIEVSDILRSYLEARYAFPVHFQTSREFLESAAKDPRLTAVQRATMDGFLGGCDRLKFARGEASEAELSTLIDSAERFIRECATGQTTTESIGGRP